MDKLSTSSGSMIDRPNICGCISINVEAWGGHRPPLLLTSPFSGRQVSIDACIAPLIQDLWNAGVQTVGSCCGHGQEIPMIGHRVYVHLAPEADLATATKVARNWPREVRFVADAI